MLTSMRKFFTEKGQGLVEYALLLAFVAVLAFIMFSDNGMQSDVGKAFSDAKSKISVAATNANSQP